MQTTTPIQTTPTTPDDLQERSRELLLPGAGRRRDPARRRAGAQAAASALRCLLHRSSDEVAREIIERATLVRSSPASWPGTSPSGWTSGSSRRPR